MREGNTIPMLGLHDCAILWVRGDCKKKKKNWNLKQPYKHGVAIFWTLSNSDIRILDVIIINLDISNLNLTLLA